MSMEALRGPEAGIIQLFQDEKAVADAVDLYAAARAKSGLLPLGFLQLEAGEAPVFLKLTGKNLATPEISFNNPKLSGKLLEEPKSTDTSVWIEVAATDDLPPAAYEVSVKTAGGMSGPLKLHVDDLPQLEESEPNNTSTAATAASLPTSVVIGLR